MPSIEITVTVPDAVFRIEPWRRKVIHIQNTKTGPDLQKLFRQTVSGWDNKPRFYKRKEVHARSIGVVVHPAQDRNGDIYALVNAGAKPHIIRPRRAKMLRFQTGYRAASRPRWIGSRRKARFGQFVGASIVRHPGFEAREFDAQIAEDYAPTFFRDMMDTFKP